MEPASQPPNSPSPVPADRAPGLPPVTPPSGRYIVQLFFVPGLIVAVAVLLLLVFRYLFGGSQTPEAFLRQLDSDNADVRWRGANDLAQVLKRKDSPLRADAKFALDLAERLRNALDELADEEKRHLDRLKKLTTQEEKDRSWRKLDPQRKLVLFLQQTLGEFPFAVGVPLLSEIALKEDSPDFQGNTLRRRQSVYALANLGNHCQEFSKLSGEQQQAIRDRLTQEGDADTTRGLWARHGLHYLDRKAPAAGIVLVDQVLAKCAEAQDQGLRAYVALALNFWDGAAVKATLLRLARDPGFGVEVRDPEDK